MIYKRCPKTGYPLCESCGKVIDGHTVDSWYARSDDGRWWHFKCFNNDKQNLKKDGEFGSSAWVEDQLRSLVSEKP